MTIETIQITRIQTREKLQPRMSLNPFALQDYTEAMKNGRVFPPVEVVWDGSVYWLWDGFHRKQAAEQAGLVELDANVTKGTLEDAQWLALSANKTHGMRRSNEDKRRAVELAFQHPKCLNEFERLGKINYTFIANHCGVDHGFVRKKWLELHPEVSVNIESWDKPNFQEILKVHSNGHTRPAPIIAPEALDLLRYTDVPEDRSELIRFARLPEEKQMEVAALIETEFITVNEATRRINQQHLHEAPPLPAGKYRVIYADPPWKYGNTMPDYFTEQADHYPLMTIDEIAALPVKEMAGDNAVLFIWVTSPILEESFQVINAWGFKYKASFVWDKIKHNMGHYNSVRHEFLLIATRGSCQPDVRTLFDSVQSIERGEHSEKPEIFREIIDTIYPNGNRIELFARQIADGWEAHGNEL